MRIPPVIKVECLSVNPVALFIDSEVSLWRYNLLENIENTIELRMNRMSCFHYWSKSSGKTLDFQGGGRDCLISIVIICTSQYC